MKDLKIETFKNSDFYNDTYVTYETAELAAGKGYPLDLSGYEWEPDEAGIPTQSLLQAWLRVVHNMNIVPVQVPDSENHIIYLNGREWNFWRDKPWISRICETGYEQCLERGLQEVLKSLK